ncbi:MAG: cell envelope integrity protein TolA, partial [Halomonas sp.]|uniref:cell envelope integrity protein TolA n=1 Tax=Halomonas sp. TaxID=1486246 RepID=UPI003F8EBFE3
DAEAEAQRKAAAAAAAAQSSLEQAIASESNAAQGEQAASSFISLVRRAVEQAWVIPPNVMGNPEAKVAVTLGPSGELFTVRITESSGNTAFDRSVEEAVQAAAPFSELTQLPASVQRDFRNFNLRFRPGDIR